MKIKLFLVILALVLTGCTQNQRARHFGGTATIELSAGRKLVNVSFREGNDLWILTRAVRVGEVPEVYEFKEHSSVGLLQGTVVIREK